MDAYDKAIENIKKNESYKLKFQYDINSEKILKKYRVKLKLKLVLLRCSKMKIGI